jgi:hypothetical protein
MTELNASGRKPQPWTAGRLRQALEAVPDDTPVVVNTWHPFFTGEVEQWAVASAGPGAHVGRRDGTSQRIGKAFGLQCRFVDEFSVEPDRVPQAEPEAGL